MMLSTLASLRHWLIWGVVGVLLSLACSRTPSVRATRSLRGSSAASVLCAVTDANGNLVGRPLDSCPDNDFNDGEERRLYTLVTQTETGEVALVDLARRRNQSVVESGRCADGTECEGRVVDLEVTQPGSNFIPVGAEPVAIVSTPGGVASFVAVAEPGREGIFGLPTSCIGPRPEGALFRDVRTWPACRLPVAPGALEVLNDTQRRTSCDDPDDQEVSPGGNAECPADLSVEGQVKLAVTLPSQGRIVVIDAQRVLDLPQGSFDDCPIERSWDLNLTETPEALPAQLPADLQGTAQECLPAGYQHPANQDIRRSIPSDLALRDGKLYVSDLNAPVIHVLDVRDPCHVETLPPLLPSSFLDPNAVITTRRVAVSPITPTGKQYVYAIDNTAGPSAGSLMVFDVSQDSGQRTPLIRSHSAEIWTEPPDRIQFDQEAADVTFAVHDFPLADPETGVALSGITCEPDPRDSRSPGALYQSTGEANEGPSPPRLRGAFAFVALHSGFVVTIDIEDLDAPCRRPQRPNASSTPNLFGCHDDGDLPLLERGGTATVTDELSCNLFRPHRPRHSGFYYAGSGGRAPVLRAFPQLRDARGTSLPVDPSDSGRRHPKLLGVPLEDGSDSFVFVGNTRYEDNPTAASRLVLDPARSERNSLLLSYQEPRAYSGDLNFTATYEGAIRSLNNAPFSVEVASELGLPEAELERLQHARYGVVRAGPNAALCESGIEDVVLMRDHGARLMSDPSDSVLARFAERHADYVHLANELLPSKDPYWATRTGQSCGSEFRAADDGLDGRFICDLVFGTPELPSPTRELRVVRAFDNRLLIEPRRFRGASERDNILSLVECCFPQGIEYRVRASEQWVFRSTHRFEHDVSTDPDTLACRRDCNPLLAGKTGRVFEISCESSNDCAVDERTPRVVGPPEFADDERALGASMVCITDQHPSGGIAPDSPGFECIHQSSTARFAIYRGLLPSERDMRFVWRVLGGFSPLSVDLLRAVNLQTSTNPVRMHYVPQINHLMIADGGSTGLLLLGLRRNDGGPGFSAGIAF